VPDHLTWHATTTYRLPLSNKHTHLLNNEDMERKRKLRYNTDIDNMQQAQWNA